MNFINNKKIASVFILIYKNSIIFIKRNRNLKTHAGEISFPGGMFDPNKDNSLLDTAYRETFEEIGIIKEDIQYIDRMKSFQTLITEIIIHPFIGKIKKKSINFKLDKKEVEKILIIPVEHFFNPKNKIVVPLKSNGKISLNTFYYYKNYLIWGATSRILDEFLTEHLPQLEIISGAR